MDTQVQRGSARLAASLAAEWARLCDEGASDEPFYRPEWIGAYLRAFEPQARLMVVTVRAAGRLRAILPLVEDVGLAGGVPARRLRAPANVHSCRFDLVQGGPADDPAPIVREIWAALRHLPGWKVLDCPYVPQSGALVRLARLAEMEGHPVVIREQWRSPYIPLGCGDRSLESVLQSLDTKFRANLRRRMRNLAAEGPVTLGLSTHAHDALLQRFYELERGGWKGAAGTAIALDPRVRHFYDLVAQEAERLGCLALYSLAHNGQPIAMHYGLSYRQRYFLLKPTYDERFARYSPGQLVVQEVIRDLISKNCREFDFLGPAMDWKQEWTRKGRPHYRCYIFQRGWAGRGLHAARFWLLPLAKRVFETARSGARGHARRP